MTAHDLPDLTWIRDLEAFEGPILTEYADADGVPYLEKWCAYVDGNAIRYLVVRSSCEAIDAYLDGKVSMMDLLTKPNDDAGWLIDGIGGVEAARVSTLPSKYMPHPNAMHDEDLRPVGFLR